MKIVTLGCSFTDNYNGVNKIWPNIVAEHFNANLVNYGKSGSSNRFAYISLINHILYNDIPDKVYWLLTEFDRVDILDNKFLTSIDYENNSKFVQYMENMTIDSNALNNMKAKIKNESKISKVFSKTPVQFLIDQNYIYIYHVQEICKSYNIELKIMQGVMPLNCYLQYDKNKVTEAIIASKYANLLDLSSIIGFPWMEIAGGFRLTSNKNWFTNYAISKSDPHPSQKGHKYIADIFLGNISPIP